MLCVEDLREDLRQQTLHILREVCGQKAILPDSCLVPRQTSKLTTEPHTTSEYAEVWKGQTDPGEGSGGTMDVCIKEIKSKARKVSGPHRNSSITLLDNDS